ncbi:MAG: DUF6796 family protein [Bacteroidota bacterium]
MNKSNLYLLRTAGVLAVTGGIINGISDYLLQGGLIARAAVNTYENLPNAPFDLVFLGGIIGNAAIPFWLLGYWPVYQALKPAGRWLSIPPVFILGYTYSLFPGYHGSYALYAAGFQAQAQQPQSEIMITLAERMSSYHDALLAVIGITSMIGSVWFVVALLSRRTHFPLWTILISPLIVPITQPLIEMLPGPYGGFIRPAWATILITLLFLTATILTWNLKKSRE